jgi:hypothetical protein
MRIIVWVAIAIVVVAGSFFGTLWFIDQFYPRLAYDVASFPRVTPGQTLTFANGENRAALISGWSVPESWGIWSDGNQAQLGFVLLGFKSANPTLFIACSPFIAPEIPEQKVELWSRDIQLGDLTLKQGSVPPAPNAPPPAIGVSISGFKLGEDYPLIVQLKIPFAKSPKELRISEDGRRLGIGLVSIRFDD